MSGRADQDEEIKSPRSKSPVMGVTSLLREQGKGAPQTPPTEGERRASGGILRLEPNKPRRRSSATSMEFRNEDPASPCPSDRLSVTWADGEKSISSEASMTLKARAEILSGNPSLTTLRPNSTPRSPPPEFSPIKDLLEEAENADDDLEASVSMILQRSASMKAVKRKKSLKKRRRVSTLTTSSAESDTDGSTSKVKIYREVLTGIKQQPWSITKKLHLARAAKEFLARHEGDLQERLAQSSSKKDVLYSHFIKFRRIIYHIVTTIYNWVLSIELWQGRIKNIESHFGSAVASYFTFLRWVLGLNAVIALLLSAFVMIPETLAGDWERSFERKIMLDEDKQSAFDLKMIWDFEGFLRYSPIFYGFYGKREKTDIGYRLPLAYILTSMCVYGYSFIAILRKMAANSRLSKLGDNEESIFTFKLFTGWDFTIGSTEAAQNKVASINMGFRESLLEAKEADKEIQSWKVTAKRVLAHLLFLLLLLGSAYAVVLLVDRSNAAEADSKSSWWRRNELTVILTLIGILFPSLFDIIGLLENHHPRKQLQWQLARIMTLNLLNLYTLIFALFGKVDGMSKNLEEVRKDLTDPEYLFQFTTAPTFGNIDPSTSMSGILGAASTIIYAYTSTDETTVQKEEETTLGPTLIPGNDLVEDLLEVRPGCRKKRIPCSLATGKGDISSLLEKNQALLNTKFPEQSRTDSSVGIEASESTPISQDDYSFFGSATSKDFLLEAKLNVPPISKDLGFMDTTSVHFTTDPFFDGENLTTLKPDVDLNITEVPSPKFSKHQETLSPEVAVTDKPKSPENMKLTSHSTTSHATTVIPTITATTNHIRHLSEPAMGVLLPLFLLFDPKDVNETNFRNRRKREAETLTTKSKEKAYKIDKKTVSKLTRPKREILKERENMLKYNDEDGTNRENRAKLLLLNSYVSDDSKNNDYTEGSVRALVIAVPPNHWKNTSKYYSNGKSLSLTGTPESYSNVSFLDYEEQPIYNTASDNESSINKTNYITKDNKSVDLVADSITNDTHVPFPLTFDEANASTTFPFRDFTDNNFSISPLPFGNADQNDHSTVLLTTTTEDNSHGTSSPIVSFGEFSSEIPYDIGTTTPSKTTTAESVKMTLTSTNDADTIEASATDSTTVNYSYNTEEYPHYLDSYFGSDQDCFTYIEICDNDTNVYDPFNQPAASGNTAHFHIPTENSTEATPISFTTQVAPAVLNPEYLVRNLSYGNRTKLRKLCWETMFGQEIVKLTVMDLVFTIVTIVVGDYIRAVIVRVCNNCCCWDLEKQFPGYPDFKIAENILHLVNNQGLVWMGMFFSPGIPAINLAKLIILLYVRSWAVTTANVPPETVFKASDNNNFYLALLLIMLFLCTLPVGYAVVWLTPSWHCGPFSDFPKIYQLATETFITSLPDWCEPIIDYISSPGVIIPGGLLLILIIYYLMSLTASLREAVQDLKDQLRSERNAEKRKAQEARSGNRVDTPTSKWGRVMPLTPVPSHHHFERKESEKKSTSDDKTPLLEDDDLENNKGVDSPIPDDVTDLGQSEVFDDSLSETRKLYRGDVKPKLDRVKDASTQNSSPLYSKKTRRDSSPSEDRKTKRERGVSEDKRSRREGGSSEAKKRRSSQDSNHDSLPRSPRFRSKHRHSRQAAADNNGATSKTSHKDSPKIRDSLHKDSPKRDSYHRDSGHHRDSPKQWESFHKDSPKSRDGTYRDSPKWRRSSKEQHKDSPKKHRTSHHHSESDQMERCDSGPKVTQPNEIEKLSKDYPELGDVFDPRYSLKDKHRKPKPISSPRERGTESEGGSPKRFSFSLKHKRDTPIVTLSEVHNEPATSKARKKESRRAKMEKEIKEEALEMHTIPIIKISKEDSVERSIQQAKLERQSKTEEGAVIASPARERKTEPNNQSEHSGKVPQDEQVQQFEQKEQPKHDQHSQQTGEQTEQTEASDITEQQRYPLNRQMTETDSEYTSTTTTAFTSPITSPSTVRGTAGEKKLLETDIDELIDQPDNKPRMIPKSGINLSDKSEKPSSSSSSNTPPIESNYFSGEDRPVAPEDLVIDPETLEEYEQVQKSFEDEAGGLLENYQDDFELLEKKDKTPTPRYKSRKPPKLRLNSVSLAEPEADSNDDQPQEAARYDEYDVSLSRKRKSEDVHIYQQDELQNDFEQVLTDQQKRDNDDYDNLPIMQEPRTDEEGFQLSRHKSENDDEDTLVGPLHEPSADDVDKLELENIDDGLLEDPQEPMADDDEDVLESRPKIENKDNDIPSDY